MKLDELHAILRFDHVVTGGADYIDTFAMLWCMNRKVSFSVEYPDWRYGNHMGLARNTTMLDRHKPTCIIAFEGDNGTRNMMAQARARGISVHEVY